ncbi:unnamed protein product [Symbiodinium natans]|uniref:Uncharacterized protein n=1 Tax=Symbiodinium natans TaxID=878477 RepID=A0A812TBJ1_9DINO|nr:unnamed protein product [Symbiodinium natans]
MPPDVPVHWNTNMVSRHAWDLLDLPGVKLLGEAPEELRSSDATDSGLLTDLDARARSFC